MLQTEGLTVTSEEQELDIHSFIHHLCVRHSGEEAKDRFICRSIVIGRDGDGD